VKKTFRILLSPDEYMFITQLLFPVMVQDLIGHEVDTVLSLLGYKSKRSFRNAVLKDRRAMEPFKILLLLLRVNEDGDNENVVEGMIKSRIVFTDPVVEKNIKTFFGIEEDEDEDIPSAEELTEMWLLSEDE